MRKKFFAAALLLLFAASGALAFTGKTKWQINLDGALSSGIASSGNLLLLGSETGRFYALNKSNGSEVWSYKGTSSVKGKIALVNDNVVFAQGDGTITCLRISDGAFIWQNLPHVNEDNTLEDGVTSGGGMIFFSKSNRLCALDAKNGHLLWEYKAGEQGLRDAPGYGDGLIFLGEYGGVMSMITPSNGKRVNGGGAGGAINTPVVKDGKVYYSSWDGSVQAVQIKSVIPLWDTRVGDPVTTSPAIGDGLVAVGTARGIVAALDAESGNLLWKFETNGGSINGDPAISEGFVFAGTEGGTLYAIDKNAGKARFTLETGAGINTDLFSDGVLYFGNADGQIYAIQ